MSQQITWNFKAIREFLIYSADFQQISTLEPNFATNFVKFSGEIFIIKSTTNNVSKKVFFIKIYPRKPKISWIECQKPVKSTENDDNKWSSMNFVRFRTFLTFNWRYLRVLWIDFDEKYLFGNVISCAFYNKNFTRKFHELHCQIWLQSWNFLKIGRVYKEFSNNFEVSSYLLGHILLFWKVAMPAIQ